MATVPCPTRTELHDQPARRALGEQRARRARRRRGGRRRSRRRRAGARRPRRPQGPGRAAPRGRERRRGAADRRELQRQSRLDGGDAEGARRRGGGRRRIAVLGAMRELGAESDEFHAALAEPLGGPGRRGDPGRRRRWKRSRKRLATASNWRMCPTRRQPSSLPARRSGPATPSSSRVQFHRTCRPRRGAGGQGRADVSVDCRAAGLPGVFNLFRYITFRPARRPRPRSSSAS